MEPATNQTAIYDWVGRIAALGLSASDGSGDYLTFHASDVTESNLWHQFAVGSRLPLGGQVLVDLLDTTPTPDPRLAEYFAPVGSQFVGADPRQVGSAYQDSARPGSNPASASRSRRPPRTS